MDATAGFASHAPFASKILSSETRSVKYTLTSILLSTAPMAVCAKIFKRNKKLVEKRTRTMIVIVTIDKATLRQKFFKANLMMRKKVVIEGIFRLLGRKQGGRDQA